MEADIGSAQKPLRFMDDGAFLFAVRDRLRLESGENDTNLHKRYNPM
jgi:hypothetical protein